MPTLSELIALGSGRDEFRHGSFSKKGKGYFGPLVGSDGRTSTELSFEFDGIEAPLLVPSLSKGEIDHLLSGGTPSLAIYTKAMQHAMDRKLGGKSVWANPLEVFRLPK